MFRAFIYIIAVSTSWANAATSVEIEYTPGYQWSKIHRSGSDRTDPKLNLNAGYPSRYAHNDNLLDIYPNTKDDEGWPAYSLKKAKRVELKNGDQETIYAMLGVHDFHFNSNFTAGTSGAMPGTNCSSFQGQSTTTILSTMYLKPGDFLKDSSCYRNTTGPVRSQGGHWSTMMSLNHVYYAVQIIKPTDVNYLRGTYVGTYTMKACHGESSPDCDIVLNSDLTAINGGTESEDVTITFKIPPSYVLSPLASTNVQLVDVKNTWLFTGQPPKTLYSEIPIRYTSNVKVGWNISCEHRYDEPTTSREECGLANPTGTVVGGIKTTIHLPRSHEVENSGGNREFQLEPWSMVTVAPALWGQDQSSIGKIAIETFEGFTEKAYKENAGERLSGRITITLVPLLSP